MYIYIYIHTCIYMCIYIYIYIYSLIFCVYFRKRKKMGIMSCSPPLQEQADKTSLTKDPIDLHSSPCNWISCAFVMTSTFACVYTYQGTTVSVPCVLSQKTSNDHVFLPASCPTTCFFSVHLLETHFSW